MTKFNELCEACTKSRNEVNGYVNGCKKFILKLRDGFAEYIDCPVDKVDFDSESFYLEGTMFYFKLGIKLFNEHNIIYKMQYNLDFKSNTDNDPTWEVFLISSIKKYEQRFEINIKNDDEYNAIYQFLYEALKDNIENQLQYLTNDNYKETTIGFGT